jgi:hypothetical protein
MTSLKKEIESYKKAIQAVKEISNTTISAIESDMSLIEENRNSCTLSLHIMFYRFGFYTQVTKRCG